MTSYPGLGPLMSTDWFRNALLCLLLSAVAGLALLRDGDLNQTHALLSDAVATPSGAVLLAMAACGLAATGAWLCAGARHPALITLLIVWSVALVAVAFFPTNLPGSPVTTAALVHRCAAAVAVGLPPLITLLTADLAARRAESDRVLLLRIVGLTTLAACVVFAAIHGPALAAGAPPLPYAGLAERLLLLLTLLSTALTAWSLKREELLTPLTPHHPVR